MESEHCQTSVHEQASALLSPPVILLCSLSLLKMEVPTCSSLELPCPQPRSSTELCSGGPTGAGLGSARPGLAESGGHLTNTGGMDDSRAAGGMPFIFLGCICYKELIKEMFTNAGPPCFQQINCHMLVQQPDSPFPRTVSSHLTLFLDSRQIRRPLGAQGGGWPCPELPLSS